MNDKTYFKITNTKSGEVLYYVSTNIRIPAEKICETLHLTDCTAVEITKEQYDAEADDEDPQEEEGT